MPDGPSADEQTLADQIIAAIAAGESFVIVMECADGTEEPIALDSCGVNERGKPLYTLCINDGKHASPVTIDMAAGLLGLMPQSTVQLRG